VHRGFWAALSETKEVASTHLVLRRHRGVGSQAGQQLRWPRLLAVRWPRGVVRAVRWPCRAWGQVRGALLEVEGLF